MIFQSINTAHSNSIEHFVLVYNVCFGLVIAFATASPAIMAALAYFYFAVKGHPWVRILRSEQLISEEEEELYAVSCGGRKKVYHVELAERVNNLDVKR